MGDIVNTASRLDDLNKKLGTRIIVSAEVIAGLEGYLARELGSFQVAGKTQDVAVYELLCRRDEATEEILELERAFADGLAAYRQKSWSEAIAGFRRCLDMREGDGPSRFFLGRCEQYRKSPPGDDWHGTVHLPDK
jgi:adenylate cyclase